MIFINDSFKLIIVLLSLVYVLNVNPITISVKNTQINGKTHNWNDTEVAVFLGIPYAKPPIGDLRFKKPVPIEKWPKVINALEWSASCMQPPIQTDGMQNKNLSEDCLHLNIWSPNINKSNELKAVMIWIHGGANFIGSSNEFQYNPLILSVLGDVVVVSINYRLGIFGFLYTGTDVGPGNMAVWDQTLAIKWVKENIKNFGGDPNKITVFGESAGSVDTSVHLISPISQKMFNNAIVMSGSALGLMGVSEPNKALEYWELAAKLIGCSDQQNTNNENRFTPQMIECLRALPSDKLSMLIFAPELKMGYTYYAPFFVVDGQHFTGKTLKIIETQKLKNKINLLIGNTEDEGSPLLAFFIDPIKYHPITPYNFTFKEAYNELKRFSSKSPSKKRVNSEEVAKLYFNGLSNKSDPDLLRRTIGIAMGDYIITCPTIQFAKALFKRNVKNINVYQYYYNSKLGKEKLICSKWMGVCHANDIWPVFGLPFNELQYNTSLDREREISAQMIQFFTDFAKTGKPTAQDGVEWPKYYTVNNIIAAPYYEITNKPKTRSNFNIGLKINECNYLWKHYLE